MTPAKRIANAIARSGIYHKRTAVLSAVLALGCCIVVFFVANTVEKGLALSFAVIFGFSAFRSLRRANRYFGLEGSPVLEAITQAPHHIRRVRPSVQGGAPAVVVSDIDDNELSLRAGPGADAVSELLEAFRHHAPRAKVEAAESEGDSRGASEPSATQPAPGDEVVPEAASRPATPLPPEGPKVAGETEGVGRAER